MSRFPALADGELTPRMTKIDSVLKAKKHSSSKNVAPGNLIIFQ